jgi:ferrous iron transport protein B
VANFPGVTVEQRMGLMAGVGRDDLTLIDLPGIYSLTPYSEDARVSIDVLRGKMRGTPKPDAVLLVLDSLHLTRQLMLAAPVLALGLPTLVLLNMSDLMEARGGHVDTLKLARELGAPVAQISAVHGTGLDAVPLFLHQQTDRTVAKPLTLPVVGWLWSSASSRWFFPSASRFLTALAPSWRRSPTLSARCCPQAGFNRCCWTAPGRAFPPFWSSCPRFCCFSCSSGFSKTPATSLARR